MAHCHYCVNPLLWLNASMTERKPQDQDKFIVRLPDGMRERIKTAAEKNNRSMNAEIVAALSDRFPEELVNYIDNGPKVGRQIAFEEVQAIMLQWARQQRKL